MVVDGAAHDEPAVAGPPHVEELAAAEAGAKRRAAHAGPHAPEVDRVVARPAHRGGREGPPVGRPGQAQDRPVPGRDDQRGPPVPPPQQDLPVARSRRELAPVRPPRQGQDAARMPTQDRRRGAVPPPQPDRRVPGPERACRRREQLAVRRPGEVRHGGMVTAEHDGRANLPGRRERGGGGCGGGRTGGAGRGPAPGRARRGEQQRGERRGRRPSASGNGSSVHPTVLHRPLEGGSAFPWRIISVEPVARAE